MNLVEPVSLKQWGIQWHSTCVEYDTGQFCQWCKLRNSFKIASDLNAYKWHFLRLFWITSLSSSRCSNLKPTFVIRFSTKSINSSFASAWNCEIPNDNYEISIQFHIQLKERELWCLWDTFRIHSDRLQEFWFDSLCPSRLSNDLHPTLRWYNIWRLSMKFIPIPHSKVECMEVHFDMCRPNDVTPDRRCPRAEHPDQSTVVH